MLTRSTQCHLAAVSSCGRCCQMPVDWASDSLLIIPTCLCIFLSNKNIRFMFMIYDYNYFQTIQRDVFYKKNTYKMFKCIFFMFLDLQGSCEIKAKEKLSVGKTTESPKDCGQFHVFVLFCYIFRGSFKFFFFFLINWDNNFKKFCLKFNFYFGL